MSLRKERIERGEKTTDNEDERDQGKYNVIYRSFMVVTRVGVWRTQ